MEELIFVIQMEEYFKKLKMEDDFKMEYDLKPKSYSKPNYTWVLPKKTRFDVFRSCNILAQNVKR